MAFLARGQQSMNPVLDLFTVRGTSLADVSSLSFQILDVSDDSKKASPVQVYPSAEGARAEVNVIDARPAGGRLAAGHYAARWTPGLSESLGLHEIRWFFQLSSAEPEQVTRETFDVVPEGATSSSSGYALVSDLRAEGVAPSDASDVRLAQLIILAGRYIERVTGRFFEPRRITLTLDGSGGRALLLGHPIIAVGSVTMAAGVFPELGVLPVMPSLFRVYNRHLSQGLVDPDDRENPRLEFFHWTDLLGVHVRPAIHIEPGSLVWLPGTQNIVVEGLFGYTEPDGGLVGTTPELIRHVTKLLVLREVPVMTDLSRREERQRRWRLVSERTRDQGYSLEALQAQGAFTGDREIDVILASFSRPPQLGAA